MPFEQFLNKPANEYELLKQIAAEVNLHFSQYHGQHYYFHLADAGNQTSFVHKVQDLTKVESAWHYAYIENDRKPCLMLRSDKDSIAIFLSGEHVCAEVRIDPESLLTVYGPKKSNLPSFRKSKLSAWERMEAFAEISGSFEELKRKKAV